MRILIIEDNQDIVANIYGFLETRGYTLDCAHNGFAGMSLAADNEFDAIVLDVMLPGIDGLELCKRLRGELRIATPVLMLTARDTLDDKVAGFEHGADDYLVKPFSLVELDVRLKALIRRAQNAHHDNVLHFGPLQFDPTTFEASRNEQPVSLTPTGYKLLAALLRVAPRVLSKELLEREVWGDEPPDSDALRTHIHSLRLAIDKPFSCPMLKTVQSIGYRLVNPDAS